MIRDLLVKLRKRRDEEDEARNLIKEMQRNLDDAQNKSYEVERKLNLILWEYIEAFDKERGRPRPTMTKLWQLMQSRDTKNLNVDKDHDEILSKIKRTGWGRKTKMKINNRHSPALKPQMESRLSFVAERVSVRR